LAIGKGSARLHLTVLSQLRTEHIAFAGALSSRGEAMSIEIGSFGFWHPKVRRRAEFAAAVGLSVSAGLCFVFERWPLLKWPSQPVVAASLQAHGCKRKALEFLHPWTSKNANAKEAAVDLTGGQQLEDRSQQRRIQ
jgi:hypothetical protein